MLNYFAKIIVFIILTVVIISCSATKRIPDNEHLLSKNTIIVDDKKISNPDVFSYLRQTPNTKILGVPISLHIYNFAKPNYEIKFQEWLEKNPDRERKLINVFSKKQVKAMEKAYNGINSWFLKNGNAPVISDSTKIKKSVISLTKYYQSKGFFDAEVSFKQVKKDNKKITVDYLVNKNNPYFIDSLTTEISSPVLDSLYQIHKDKSLVVVGDQIDYTKFENEENRLINIFRNSGVYNFGKNNMEYWIDTLGLSPYKTSVFLEINDRVVEKNDSVYTEPFKIRKVKKVNVFTDFSFADKNKPIQDSAYYKGFNFYATEKLAYKPKHLANAIIIQPDSIYKDTEQQLTRKYLRELQNFRPSLDIKYEENKDGSLTANINLTPEKKYSFGFDNEYITSNIKEFGILGKVSWLNRNLFKGAEVLDISFQGSFVNSSLDASNDSKFLGLNSWEIGSSATLKFPRILFPFGTKKIIPKRMTPKTNIGLSVALQRNIGLDRQNITGGINYTWQSSRTTDHKFELLNAQYIRNLRTDKYFGIYRSEGRKLDEIAEIITPDPNYITENGELLFAEDGDLISSNYLEFLLDPDKEFSISNPTEYE